MLREWSAGNHQMSVTKKKSRRYDITNSLVEQSEVTNITPTYAAYCVHIKIAFPLARHFVRIVSKASIAWNMLMLLYHRVLHRSTIHKNNIVHVHNGNGIITSAHHDIVARRIGEVNAVRMCIMPFYALE